MVSSPGSAKLLLVDSVYRWQLSFLNFGSSPTSNSHYFFASGGRLTSVAMFTAFPVILHILEPWLLSPSFPTSWPALQHNGIGSAPVFYGANYVPLGQMEGYGFLITFDQHNSLAWGWRGLVEVHWLVLEEDPRSSNIPGSYSPSADDIFHILRLFIV
ncbi:hypothetical protein NC651_022079 [Populus alba x Populus x berolinensis]|nr:hypothetical protein NC651_022079 [Populus alba x Populus x berolinensis]